MLWSLFKYSKFWYVIVNRSTAKITHKVYESEWKFPKMVASSLQIDCGKAEVIRSQTTVSES